MRMGYADEMKSKQDERKARGSGLELYHNRDLPRPSSASESASARGIGNATKGIKPQTMTEAQVLSKLFGIPIDHAARPYKDTDYFAKEQTHKYGTAPIRGASNAELISMLAFGHNPHLERMLRFGDSPGYHEFENEPMTEAERRLMETGDRDLYEAMLMNMPERDKASFAEWAKQYLNKK